jgi:HPt (histidine-containing phosphotransfer) domain-containing protein
MSTEPVDPRVFAELRTSAGAEFADELLGTFREETPRLLAELAAAHAAGDAVGFRRLAHSIKSSANTFGAVDLAAAARALELGGLPADGAPLVALQVAYERAAQALQEIARG